MSKIESKVLWRTVKQIEARFTDDAVKWRSFKAWLDENDFVTLREAGKELKVWHKTLDETIKHSTKFEIIRRCRTNYTTTMIKRKDLLPLLNEAQAYKKYKKRWV